jgi:hypothetical protein
VDASYRYCALALTYWVLTDWLRQRWQPRQPRISFRFWCAGRGISERSPRHNLCERRRLSICNPLYFQSFLVEKAPVEPFRFPTPVDAVSTHCDAELQRRNSSTATTFHSVGYSAWSLFHMVAPPAETGYGSEWANSLFVRPVFANSWGFVLTFQVWPPSIFVLHIRILPVFPWGSGEHLSVFKAPRAFGDRGTKASGISNYYLPTLAQTHPDVVSGRWREHHRFVQRRGSHAQFSQTSP